MIKINILHRVIFSILDTKDWKKLKQEKFIDNNIFDFFISKGLSVWMFIFNIGTILQILIILGIIKNCTIIYSLFVQSFLFLFIQVFGGIYSTIIYKKYKTKINMFLSDTIEQDNNEISIKKNELMFTKEAMEKELNHNKEINS